jgi:hypothetical protein
MPENLFVVTDPLGREVRLTENCYQYHIVVEHPEIADVEIIEEVVTLPDLIAQDAVNRIVWYTIGSISRIHRDGTKLW